MDQFFSLLENFVTEAIIMSLGCFIDYMRILGLKLSSYSVIYGYCRTFTKSTGMLKILFSGQSEILCFATRSTTYGDMDFSFSCFCSEHTSVSIPYLNMAYETLHQIPSILFNWILLLAGFTNMTVSVWGSDQLE